MRFLTNAVSALTAVVALMIVGCGGLLTTSPFTQSGAARPFMHRPFGNARAVGFLVTDGGIVRGRSATRPSFMDRRAVGKPLLFVAYNYINTSFIDIYTQGGKNKLVGQMNNVPVGAGAELEIDRSGNLYSFNYSQSNSRSVTVYAPPYTGGPKLTLTGLIVDPIAVSRQGTLAVGVCTGTSLSHCDFGISFYAAGSTTPCTTVLVDSPYGVFGAAFDHQGNLYFDIGSTSSGSLNVGRITGGCKAKKYETFTTTQSGVAAGDVKIDKAGRIAILTAAVGSPYQVLIDTYDPPKKGSLGNPVSVTPLAETINTATGTFAFQASGHGLWDGYNVSGSKFYGGAREYTYPAGGSPRITIQGPSGFGAYGGVAVTPALFP